jgi:hypothetical protein
MKKNLGLCPNPPKGFALWNPFRKNINQKNGFRPLGENHFL